jgi:type IV protein arginine methyltransferase
MEQLEVTESDVLLGQRILSAASRHDVDALRVLLEHGSANVRDPATGTAPLHAAIEACKGSGDEDATGAKSKEDAAVKTLELLLQNGAIWNDLNKANETPGCIALRSGQKRLYSIMVEAGVRAELLFGKMGELGLVDEDMAEDEENGADPAQASSEQEVDDVSKDNHAYLKSELRYRPGILLDSSDNAVMMDWETTIMKRHAETLLPKKGLRAMNVGHGMGIVDRAIQSYSPGEHHIVEAHPQVQQRLRETGWYDKPNVFIHEGRWQDVLPKLVEKGVILDAIYYDTFAEDYAALKEFFSEYVTQLLDESGRLGWYNGLGADRQICYDVYSKVS